MKKLLRVIFINIIILLGLLVFIEIIFRVLEFGYGNAPLESDSCFHHVHPKSYSFRFYVPSGEYGGHIVKYDQYRRRVNDKNGNENNGNKEIWFLGDSFTESVSTCYDSSFVGRIDASTYYNVLNYGTSSYSPLIYFIQLKDALTKQNKPELVFIQLYSNDVTDDERYAKMTRFNSHDIPIACNGGRSNFLIKFMRKFYIARVSKRALLTLQYFLNKARLSQGIDNKINNYVEQAPIITGTRFEKSINQIHLLLDSMKIKHYFFAIPSKYSCISGDWKTPTFSSNFNVFAVESKYPYIDVIETFKKVACSKKLFFNEDIHCNDFGNKLMAQELLKEME